VLARNVDLSSQRWSSPRHVRYFDPPLKRVQISFKAEPQLRASLWKIVRLWRIVAAIQKAKASKPSHDKANPEEIDLHEIDPDDIDFTFVCEKLLGGAASEVWADVMRLAELKNEPETDDDWVTLERALWREAKQKQPT
jgi:hypothetical protein